MTIPRTRKKTSSMSSLAEARNVWIRIFSPEECRVSLKSLRDYSIQENVCCSNKGRVSTGVSFLPEDADDGEELEDVGVLEVGGEDLEQVVDVEAQRRHVVDDVHAREKKQERKIDRGPVIQSLISEHDLW